MAYVYRHIRFDTNEVFYIGIGSDNDGKYKRAYDTGSRSYFWNNIVSKTNYKVEIILNDITWEEACLKEIELIEFYGRRDLNKGTLVNMTDGGDGILGYIFSRDSREKRSISKLGDKNPSFGVYFKHTKEAKDKMKLSRAKQVNQPMQGKTHSEETKEKMKLSSKNKKKIQHIETGLIFNSQNEASQYFNIPVSTISWQVRNKTKFIAL
jgi:hypothetical protein